MSLIRNLLVVLLIVSIAQLEFYLPGKTQSTSCTKVKITPLGNFPIEIPTTPGDTNSDNTFENIDQFADLDIPSNKETNQVSFCIHRNNAARILSLDPTNGALSLSDSLALTDPISSSNYAATRGVCSVSPQGDQLFFPGIGPAKFGYDRIYLYNITSTKVFSKPENNYFYIPSDLTKSTAITPNGKYLVYLQANTSNKNLASLLSVEIKADKSLSQSSVGQDLAQTVSAGTYLEIAKEQDNTNLNFVYGAFANLQQGKNASGDSFGIFQTNQTTGTNTILAEFKKGDTDFPLPDLFNTSSFVGFSGFKLVKKDSDLFLFISYIENNSDSLPGFNYITKLALFKVNIKNNLGGSLDIVQAGKAITTAFQLTPCGSNNFHGISGPLWISNDLVYIVDNNSSQAASGNYIAAYFVNWDNASLASQDTEIMKLASLPQKITQSPGERPTDLIISRNNKFAYIASIDTKTSPNAKIIGYSLEESTTNCNQLNKELIDSICNLPALETQQEEPFKKPDAPLPQAVKLNQPAQTSSTSSVSTSNTSLAPVNFFPLQGTQTLNIGRPPLFGSPPFGSKLTNIGRPPSAWENFTSPFKTESNIANNAFKEYKPSSAFIKDLTNNQQKIPSFPSTVLTPTETKTFNTLNIDIKSLELRGEDQIVIAPRTPYISFNTKPLETAKIESVSPSPTLKASPIDSTAETSTPKAETLPPIIQSSEIRGAISGGTGTYLISLKQGVALKTKDLKSIIHVVIDNNKNITILPATNTLTSTNKILATLTFPNILQSGTVTLATLLNRGGTKREVIAKSKMKILNPFDFENAGEETNKIVELPLITKILGRIAGDSYHGGKIIRLTFVGKNFASRLIKINNQLFIAEPLKAHTSISFGNEKDFEILRVRVLNKGSKMFVTLRFTGSDLNNIPFTISTPKGQLVKDKLGIKLFSQSPVRSVTLDLDREKEKKK